MADRTMTAGDLEPPLRATLVLADDPSLATITANIRGPQGPNETLITGTCLLLDGVQLAPNTYRVEMRSWDQGETDAPGVYFVDFELDWGGGRIQTVPSRPRRLVIVPALDAA